MISTTISFFYNKDATRKNINISCTYVVHVQKYCFKKVMRKECMHFKRNKTVNDF